MDTDYFSQINGKRFNLGRATTSKVKRLPDGSAAARFKAMFAWGDWIDQSYRSSVETCY